MQDLITKQEAMPEKIVYGIISNTGKWLCGNDRIGRYFSDKKEDLEKDIVVYSKPLKAENESRNYPSTIIRKYERK